MSAIKDAFHHVVQGVENVAKGLGDVAKGVLTLNPKEIGDGIKEGVSGVSSAVNTLTGNSLAGVLGSFEWSRAQWLPDGQPPKPGTRWSA